jgi:hypothetical protein
LDRATAPPRHRDGRPGTSLALAAADVIVPLAIALILLAVILFGSTEMVERVFRLWDARSLHGL